MKKKSLVGWTRADWKLRYSNPQTSWHISEVKHNYIGRGKYSVPSWLAKVKVRITIEEICRKK